jgi:hypothetical protein
MCLPPPCFETGVGFAAGFEAGQSRNFSKKIEKIDEVIEGKHFLRFVL